MYGNKWTNDEDNIIRYNYLLPLKKLVLLLPQRTINAVRGRLSTLNLTKAKYVDWTKDEINFLIENQGKYTARELSNILGHSYGITNNKCRELNLKLKVDYKKWTDEEISILKNNCNIDKMCELIPGRTRESIILKCKRESIDYETRYDYWTEDDILLLKKCNNKTMEELRNIFRNKSDATIHYNANKIGIVIEEILERWTKEEDNILINNSDHITKYEELQELLPYRTLSSIKKRFKNLKLRTKKSRLPRSEKLSKRNVKNRIKHYKNHFGIILDDMLFYNTYNPVQWWKWTYYNTPNGSCLKNLPMFICNDENALLIILKYVIENEMGLNTREKIINLSIKLIYKYKVNFHRHGKNFCSPFFIINNLYPEYNIRAFELNNVPLGYWKNINNADEYMKYYLEEFLCVNDIDISDIKYFVPNMLTYKNIRELGFSMLGWCLTEYKYYNSFYDWINYLYPEWMLTSDDFKEKYTYDGVRVYSHEEADLYNYIKRDLKLNLKSTGTKNNIKYHNDKYNENYIPDFILKFMDYKPIIIEYYGFARMDSDGRLAKTYVAKAKRKNEYYENNKDIYFLAFYPQDLKRNFEGVREKLTSFFMSNFNINLNDLYKEVNECLKDKD